MGVKLLVGWSVGSIPKIVYLLTRCGSVVVLIEGFCNWDSRGRCVLLALLLLEWATRSRARLMNDTFIESRGTIPRANVIGRL